MRFNFLKIKKTENQEKSNELVIEFIVSMLSDMSYSEYQDVNKKVAEIVFAEIYPQIKEKLLEKKNIDLIVGEVRALIASKILQSTS